VIIEYQKDVPGTAYTPAHVPGERFTIASAAKAKMLHPDAAIIGYEDGAAFNSRTDDSMIELRDAIAAEEAAAQAAAEKAAAEEAEREKAEAEARKEAEAEARKAKKGQ